MTAAPKRNWRLEPFITSGYSLKQLQIKENLLWKQAVNTVKHSVPPPSTLADLSDSYLIGYGWEWAVYGFSRKDYVIKVPAGIFPEVNEPSYLERSITAYRTCERFLGHNVIKTSFERRLINSKRTNCIIQSRFEEEEIQLFTLSALDLQTRQSLSRFGKNVLEMLLEISWLPDFNLHRMQLDGVSGWYLRNVVIKENQPYLFDFSSYYDVFTLYPERNRQEVNIKEADWKTLLEDLS